MEGWEEKCYGDKYFDMYLSYMPDTEIWRYHEEALFASFFYFVKKIWIGPYRQLKGDFLFFPHISYIEVLR